MPAEPLAYEHVPLHPGRFRVQELADAMEIELVPRSGFDKLPWIALIWIGTLVGIVLVWWWCSRPGPYHVLGAQLVVAAMTAPAAAIVATFQIIWRDRQQLHIRLDAESVTITRYMIGGPDRQVIALADLRGARVGQKFREERNTVIIFTTRIGGVIVPIARRPRYVAEMCQLLVSRIEKQRRSAGCAESQRPHPNPSAEHRGRC